MSTLRRIARSMAPATGSPGNTPPSPRRRRRVAAPLDTHAPETVEPTDSDEWEDNTFSEDFLMNAVRGMDTASEEIRTGSDLIHVSSLLDYCARRESLAWITRNSGAPVRKQAVMSGIRIIWALGRAAETHVRKQFIASNGGRGVLGMWTCKCGQANVQGTIPRLTSCARCDGPINEYLELPLADHDSKVVGNPDLLYVRPDNGLVRVVEIKSMNVTEFKALEAPLANHVLQAASYNRLAEINQLGPDNAVTILYVCKDFIMRPYKSFTVEITPQITNAIDAMFNAAAERADWLDARRMGASNDLPARLRLCSGPQAPRAKRCPECVGCFSSPDIT